MTTYTAAMAKSGVQPKSFHVGVQGLYAEYSATAALASGDVILMAKLPTDARLLSIVRNYGLGTGNDLALQLGYNGTLSALASTATGAAGVSALNNGYGHLLSLSDGASPRYHTLKLHVASIVSASATGVLALTVLFTRDIGK